MIRRVRDFLSRRRQAYSRVFDTEETDHLGDRRIVLDDLMKFCRFGETPYHTNPRKTDALIGRQEVMHRILDHAGLDLETLYGKYNTDQFKLRIQPGEHDV